MSYVRQLEFTMTRWAVINYVGSFIGAAVTYGMMLREAYVTGDWIHIVTLTPLFPYLVAAGLAYRHRRRPRQSAAIAGLVLLTVVVGWPLFWNYYLPANVRPATKVVVKIVLPVVQGMVVVVAGVVMEIRSGARRSDVPRY